MVVDEVVGRRSSFVGRESWSIVGRRGSWVVGASVFDRRRNCRPLVVGRRSWVVGRGSAHVPFHDFNQTTTTTTHYSRPTTHDHDPRLMTYGSWASAVGRQLGRLVVHRGSWVVGRGSWSWSWDVGRASWSRSWSWVAGRVGCGSWVVAAVLVVWSWSWVVGTWFVGRGWWSSVREVVGCRSRVVCRKSCAVVGRQQIVGRGSWFVVRGSWVVVRGSLVVVDR